MFFKNWKMKNRRFINTVASTTFGVLLIHANSDAMRQWLWKDFLKLPLLYDASFQKLVVVYVLVMVGVFAVCCLIDLIRIYLIERPAFNLINRKSDDIEACYRKVEIKVKGRIRGVLMRIKL